MDHGTAVKSDAAMRYILGEMRAQERDSFEDHYFGCMWCAEEVCRTALFVDDVRRIVRGKPRRKQVAMPTSSSKRRIALRWNRFAQMLQNLLHILKKL
jgi:hypothetical protein